jgi:hypothetical protein
MKQKPNVRKTFLSNNFRLGPFRPHTRGRYICDEFQRFESGWTYIGCRIARKRQLGACYKHLARTGGFL